MEKFVIVRVNESSVEELTQAMADAQISGEVSCFWSSLREIDTSDVYWYARISPPEPSPVKYEITVL